jgi:hypothetical protein
MRHPIVVLSFAVTLGVLGSSASAVAQQGPASGSLLGPLTAQRSDTGMVISGTRQKLPAGTKIWVDIIHQPGGPQKPVSGPEDDHVIVNSNGTFQANLQSLGSITFKAGLYKIMITSFFNSGWQTVDVLRKAGVELDSQGRSSVRTDPKAIPESPDFKPDDPEFPKASRHLSVIRGVKLESLPANLGAIEAVKSATLFVQGRGWPLTFRRLDTRLRRNRRSPPPG